VVDKVAKGIYEFGPFRLDATERTLTREGEPVELTPQRFDILLYLLRSAGRVLDKWELLRAVWDDLASCDENNLNNAIGELRKALGDTQKPYRYVETVRQREGHGYRFAAQVREIGVPTSLAVLPFIPHDPGDEGGGEVGRGMDDAIVTRLNKIKAIVVRPKSATNPRSVRPARADQGAADRLAKGKRGASETFNKFAQPDRDPVALGHQLVVDYVLDCRIRRSGRRIRVHARIVGVRKGETLWKELFDENDSDIFELEDLISEQVIRVLKLKPTDEELGRVTKRHTKSPEAYEKYKLGRDLRNLFTEEGLLTAIEYFKQALEIDPDYAKAYNAVADCHLWLGLYNLRAPADAFPLAAEFVKVALAKDETIAGAHTVNAYLSFLHGWDAATAETEFKRAIELNPNYAMAYLGYALLLMAMGRIEQALEQLRVALMIDPLSPVLRVAQGIILYIGRQYGRGTEQLVETVDHFPNYDPAYYSLSMSYLQSGEFDKAIEYAQKGKALSHRNPLNLSILALAYASSGEEGEARQALEELSELSGQRYVSPYHLSLVCAAVGEPARAYEFLKEALDTRDQWLVLWRLDPKFDELRSDKKVVKLLQSVTLS
jgi:DNA-binding winged helix-turn-helix (wHTH) protein/Tfp pilus assembly protein PilF